MRRDLTLPLFPVKIRIIATQFPALKLFLVQLAVRELFVSDA